MDYIHRTFSLEGEIVVITGGAGVIARSLATGYLKAGAKVSLWGRRLSELEKSRDIIYSEQESFQSLSINVHVVDCRKLSDLRNAYKRTCADIGTPTILVNCVGGNKGKTAFVDQNPDLFMEVVELNLIAGLLLPSQTFCKLWIQNSIPGIIINLASMASYRSFSGVWAYNAAKAGVLKLTQGMAREFVRHGIRVNSISPGFFLGKQNKSLLVESDEPFIPTERGKKILERTPMGRFGNNEDLQGAAIFLASRHASSFITGIDIPVDGGFLADGI